MVINYKITIQFNPKKISLLDDYNSVYYVYNYYFEDNKICLVDGKRNEIYINFDNVVQVLVEDSDGNV